MSLRTIARKAKHILLGRPLRNDQMGHEKLSVLWGLPIMASDAVSSVAYAIEEVLLVLVPVLAAAAYFQSLLVVIPIFVLLGVLIFSYTQMIKKYPGGGGAYSVTQENISRGTSLLAASTLVVAYILTVTVSVSSASQALISAFPALDNFVLPICLGGIALLTLLNLRGVGESAKIFGVPTYLFVVMIVLLLGVGFVRLLTGGITPIVHGEAAVNPSKALEGAGAALLFLFLRAFSSGCSALTGVEAVSNAVPLFREPSRRTATRVLLLLGGIILLVFGGTAVLSSLLKPVLLDPEAKGYETVLSQLGHRVFGGLGLPGDIFYYALQGFTVLILLLAANTAYSGLPQLLAILARDSYMPRQFAHRGAKLSFSNGILFIGLAAGALVVLFKADTHRMIPLYAAGVFITFTLSQIGMFVLWRRSHEKGWRRKAAVNLLGALITVTGGVTVLVVRFKEGAWLLFFVLPLLMWVMHVIHKHYAEISEGITQAEFKKRYRPSKSLDDAPFVVMLAGLTRSSLKLLNYANSLTHNVKALCVADDEDAANELRQCWQDWEIDIELVVINAPFREILLPLHEYVEQEEKKLRPHETLTVLLSKIIDRRWYAFALHNQTSYFIQRELSQHRNVATILLPFLHK